MLLRHDNADLRLAHHAHALGLIGGERYAQVERKRATVHETLDTLRAYIFTPSQEIEQRAAALGLTRLGQRLTAEEVLRRPDVDYAQVAALADGAAGAQALPAVDGDTATEIELRVKYTGYIRRQEQMVRQVRRLEAAFLPDDVDYATVPSLRTEARQQLTRVRPRTIGQASRIPGVTPADVAVLLIHIERARARGACYPLPLRSGDVLPTVFR